MTVSLSQQIEEVDRELALRKNVYARNVASGKMRQSIADYHTNRMEAVKRTLEWLAENEAAVRAAIGERAT